MSSDHRWPAEWLRGVLEVCALSAVAEGHDYGYAVAARLNQAGLGVVKGGTLYPLLARLETDGLLQSSWQAGDGGPGRKIFHVTPHGSGELARRAALWQEFTAVTTHLVAPHTVALEPQEA